MDLLICNGPNLNLLGVREPSIYGTQSFEAYFEDLCKKYPEINLHYFQSNCEGALIDKLHEIGFNYNGILLNAGAYTHTSIALKDAIDAISTPVLEIHISNVFKRESFRHHSCISAACVGGIFGLGLESYQLGINYFIENNNKNK